MINTLKLLLPGLIPSWEFFKAVQPSPRVQWRLLDRPHDDSPEWHEFRPRPAYVSPLRMGLRLFWNPVWNETLYLVSLSERLMLAPTAHSADEIRRRLAAEVNRTVPPQEHLPFLQFRLVFVSRDTGGLTQTTTHVAEPRLLSEIAP